MTAVTTYEEMVARNNKNNQEHILQELMFQNYSLTGHVMVHLTTVHPLHFCHTN